MAGSGCSSYGARPERTGRRLVVLVALVSCLALASLVSASPAAATAQTFTASLSGAQEVPANASAATGTGTVRLNEAETEITVNASFTGLGSNATAAHIHNPGGPGVNAGILFGLAGVPAATSGSVAQNQTFAITADQVAQLRAGQMYFNVHSASLPGGEIRGQIVSETFTTTLSGTQEVPSNTSGATATGTVLLNAAENQITVNLKFSGLESNATAAHIHSPGGTGVNSGILFGLTGVPAATTGSLTANQTFAVTSAQVTLLKTGRMYFNLHSTGRPGGEIRAQIVPGPSQPAVARTSTTWLMRDRLGSIGDASQSINFLYGARPLAPLMGDWDGNGTRTAGTREAGVFKLRNFNAPGAADETFTFGDPRGFPVAGDFNADGTDDVAVYRNGTWQIRLSTGTVMTSFSFGSGNWPNTVPVAGDWNGDGTDGIGTYTLATGAWSLRNTASAGAADAGTFNYSGVAVSYYPVVGDWDANGTHTVGVKVQEGATWLCRNTNSAGAADTSFDFGQGNDFPLVWGGSAATG